MSITKTAASAAIWLSCAMAPMSAAILDLSGDLLPTYTGPAVSAVDVLGASVIYNPSAATFTFSGTLAGNPATAPAGTLYVFGLNRGAGTERFVGGSPSIGAGISFDEVVLLTPSLNATVNDFINAVVTPVPGAATITGNTITATLPSSLFPSEGFLPQDFTFNFWPRVGLGSNAQISDFAPNSSNAGVTAVPEPVTTALLGLCFLAAGLAAKRRK